MNLESKQEFYNLYTKPFVTDKELDEAFDFKDRLIPKNLYRYRKPNQFTLDEIQSSKVCLIPASNQNDEFDTTLKINFMTISKILANQRRDKYLNMLNPPASDDELEIINSSADTLEGISIVLASRGSMIATDVRWKSIFEERISEIGKIFSQSTQTGTLISSFSESSSLLNMWEKYSEDSKGICISYPMANLIKDSYVRRYMFPIVYSDDSFNATDDFLAKIQEPSRRKRIAIGASMTKTLNWKTEREWRLISFEGKVIHHKFVDMPLPTCIFLGRDIEPEFEEEVRSSKIS